MSASLTKDIIERAVGFAVQDMAKGKAPGHNGIPVEFFQQLWSTFTHDFHQMILKGIEEWELHEGITKGIISLILKEGDSTDLNYWRPITLLMIIYKKIAKIYL